MGVWNDDYIPTRIVKINGGPNITAIAIDPGGCANEILEHDSVMGEEMHIGRKNLDKLSK